MILYYMTIDLLRDKFVLSDACPASVSSLQGLRYGLILLLLLDVLLPTAVHTDRNEPSL